MKNILFLFLSFFSLLQLPAQIISGVVLDSATQSPLPYVNIVNLNTRIGTFSNTEGRFSLAVEQLPARLMLTHVSYQSRTLVIDEINDDYEINLSLGVTQLYDVVVENLDLEEIVKEAWKRNKAFGNQDFFGEAFYRQLSKVNDEFTEVHESFYEVLYNNQGFDRWQMTNGRYAFKEFLDHSKKEKTPFIVNFSSLSKIMKIYYESSAPIIVPAGPLVRGFTYQLEDYKIIDNDTLLIINCQPIPKLKDKFILSGLLTVRKNDYALLNFKGESTHPFVSKKDPYFKYYEQQNNFKKIEIDYSVSVNLQSFRLNYITISESYEHRKKGTENWRKVNIESKLYFYQHESAEGIDIAKKKKGYLLNNDRDLIAELEYDVEFWRDNPIVKRTILEEEAIKAFEKDKSFVGKMFKKN